MQFWRQVSQQHHLHSVYGKQGKLRMISKFGMVAHACNPFTQKAGTGGSLQFPGHCVLHSNLQATRYTLQNFGLQKQNIPEKEGFQVTEQLET